ncbi:hypothetical protein NIES4103_08760 [Nostoc sp. NIES-4103]|nr:hypothetical protein NIES4103_08760 [Nostoc sp. NIES-4103]
MHTEGHYEHQIIFVPALKAYAFIYSRFHLS